MFVHRSRDNAGKYERKGNSDRSFYNGTRSNRILNDKPKALMPEIVAKILTWIGVPYYAWVWFMNIRTPYGDVLLAIAITVGIIKAFSIGWRVFHKRRMDNLEYRLKKKEVDDEIFPHQ